MADTMPGGRIAEAKPYLAGGLATSLVGAALLLFTDFAGWTDYYDYYVAIGAEETPGYATPLLLATGIGLVFCAFCAASALASSNASSAGLVRAGVIAAGAVVGTIIGGTLVFMQEVSDTDGWWFDTGFYGGIIGAGLTAFLLQRAFRLMMTPPAPTSQPLPPPPTGKSHPRRTPTAR